MVDDRLGGPRDTLIIFAAAIDPRLNDRLVRGARDCGNMLVRDELLETLHARFLQLRRSPTLHADETHSP